MPAMAAIMNRNVDMLLMAAHIVEDSYLSADPEIGVIVVQADELARINNAAGAAAGDSVLQEIGSRLKNFVHHEFGGGSLVARLDGPRFLIVPAVPTSLAALSVHERSLHLMLAEPLVGDPHGRVAIRMATSLLRADQPVAPQLRAACDQLARPTSARDGAQVKMAIENDEVRVFYQPQYDVSTGEMVGVEALIRWQHPDLGLLGAGPLVTAARAARLEIELTEHVHRVALREVAAWPAALGHLRLALNITAADLADLEFADRFTEMVQKAGVDPERLTLELTEQAMLSDPAIAGEQLVKLRDGGMSIAIDDFGTGYSSLSLLARLPIDYLKIDSGFTQTLDGTDRDRIVVRAIVDLAKALGLVVVAEGVEQEQQLVRLAELGVGLWQGFLRSSPVPGDELLALMS